MTPSTPIIDDQTRPSADPPAATLPLGQYPRLADALRQFRAPSIASQAASSDPIATTPWSDVARPAEQMAAVPDAPLAPAVAHAVVHEIAAAQELKIAPARTAAPVAPMVETLEVAGTSVVPATVLAADDAALTEAEIDELIAELGMRDLAREALRARMIALATSTRQRTAYELVFIMLAFSVMVLLSAPPVVQIALALHGTAPN
jgi:hypothetical protein